MLKHKRVLFLSALITVCLFRATAFASEKKEVLPPLIQAAHDGNLAELKKLIEKGVDVNMRHTDGSTALMLSNEKKAIEFLIKAGAQVNEHDNDGQTALHRLVLWEGRELIDLLIKAGADVNSRDKGGWTPLHAAALLHNVDAIEFLCEKGANVNAKASDGSTPLHIAATFLSAIKGEESNLKTVVSLIKCGADVNAIDDEGGTPLHDLAKRKDVATCLVNVGADVHVCNKNKQTPLHCFAAAKKTYFELDYSECAAMVDCFIKAGANINARDISMNTPLIVAAAYGSADDMVALIDAGAELKALNIDGLTPLQLIEVVEEDQCSRSPLLSFSNTDRQEFIRILTAAEQKVQKTTVQNKVVVQNVKPITKAIAATNVTKTVEQKKPKTTKQGAKKTTKKKPASGPITNEVTRSINNETVASAAKEVTIPAVVPVVESPTQRIVEQGNNDYYSGFGCC